MRALRPPSCGLAPHPAAVIIRGRAQSKIVIPWPNRRRAVPDRKRSPLALRPARKRRGAPPSAPRRRKSAKRRPSARSRRRKAKWVYTLRRRQGRRHAPACANLLGGKGANLAEMANLGLPVPPGFTITTEVCTLLLRQRQDLSGGSRRRRSTPALAEVGTHHRQDVRRRRPIRCWCRCAPARAPRCRA